MLMSTAEAREAEREARRQRPGLAHLLCANESKARSAADVMRIRQFVAAAAEGSITYDILLSEYEQRLFTYSAPYFAHASDIICLSS